jgi:ribosome biogenesis protein Tsr3
VEALAAALLLLGEAQRAERLLGGFAGGAAFLKVNHLRLTRYARADNVEALLQIEAEEI